jgi:predicted nucleic acid-binding protein
VNRTYFVDSWYLIALFDRSDGAHLRAVSFDRLSDTTSSFVTHDGVLTEVLAFFAGEGAYVRQQIVTTVRSILNKRNYTVARSSDLFDVALDLYERRPDKEYSLVDCASMVLMKRLDIRHVLTNDHHFRQEGFVVVNE